MVRGPRTLTDLAVLCVLVGATVLTSARLAHGQSRPASPASPVVQDEPGSTAAARPKVVQDEPGPTAFRPPPPPAPREEPRPFATGVMDLGLTLGLSAGQETAFSLGAGFGYFVLPGLEPGLEVDVTFGSNRPTVVSLLPYLRWVVWRSYLASPYLKVQGGRWFITDQDDLSPVGGGGGLVFFLSPSAGVQLEAMVFRLFPEEACPSNGCTVESFGLSFGLFFGGR